MRNKHNKEFTEEDREQILEMLSLAQERLEQSAEEHFKEDWRLYTFLDLRINTFVVEALNEAIIINKLIDFDVKYYEDETT
jgi:hypothetical protein